MFADEVKSSLRIKEIVQYSRHLLLIAQFVFSRLAVASYVSSSLALKVKCVTRISDFRGQLQGDGC